MREQFINGSRLRRNKKASKMKESVERKKKKNHFQKKRIEISYL